MAAEIEGVKIPKPAHGPTLPPPSVYEQLGQEIGRLVATKQKQYGDSFSTAPKILALLYPDGVPVDRYDSLLAVVRILDKLKRVATQDPTDTEDHWGDLCGYSLLMLARGRT